MTQVMASAFVAALTSQPHRLHLTAAPSHVLLKGQSRSGTPAASPRSYLIAEMAVIHVPASAP